MGLFDEIQFEYKLPPEAEAVQNHTFQTKDFESLLDNYLVTADGSLILRTPVYEEIPEEERVTRSWGYTATHRQTGEWKDEEVVDFHGDIEAYTSVGKIWYQLQIRFTYGKVEWIKASVDQLGTKV